MPDPRRAEELAGSKPAGKDALWAYDEVVALLRAFAAQETAAMSNQPITDCQGCATTAGRSACAEHGDTHLIRYAHHRLDPSCPACVVKDTSITALRAEVERLKERLFVESARDYPAVDAFVEAAEERDALLAVARAAYVVAQRIIVGKKDPAMEKLRTALAHPEVQRRMKNE